ncbi:MAG TPA: polysaccharide biosynthesis C-terminal domain-containing protein [Bacteroidales bacterium]|nr:polysaccharide biosynthesis C-terminal domain-containing protein [Bacteroidales bacterium]
MIEIFKKITKNTFIYSIGQIAPKLVGLILLPFFTDPSYLSAGDYGKLSMLEATSMFLISMFGFGLNYALERWYWDKEYINKRKSIIFTLIVATIFITGVVWGFLSFFSNNISMLLTGREDWVSLIKLLFICSAIESLILIPSTLLRLQEKPLFFVSANIIRFFLYLILTFVFLISMKRGLEGIYEARLLSLAGVMLVLAIPLFKNISFHFEWKALKDMIYFRLPLVLSTLSYVIFNITDRFSLRFLSTGNFQDVGVYSLGFTLTNSVKVVVISAIWLSVRPMIYSKMHEEGNRRFYSKLMKYMIFVITSLLLSISLFGQEIISLLTRNSLFGTSYFIVPIISLAIIFDTLKDISQSIGLIITKKTGTIAITMVIATILNILLNIVLIPFLNIYGAALSTVISQFFFFVVIYRYSQKQYPIKYEIRRIAVMIMVFVFLAGLSLMTSSLNLMFRLPIKLILIASFPVILLFMNYYEDIETTRLRQLWGKLKSPSEWMNLISKK